MYARGRERKQSGRYNPKTDKTRCTVSVFGLYRVSAWGRLFLPCRCHLFNIVYTAQGGGDNVDFWGGYED